MAWTPISGTLPQYEKTTGVPYSGAVLKFYAAGTTTPINVAIDSAGVTTVGSIALDSDGYPSVSGTPQLPFVDQTYKIVLYPTQAAADTDTGSLWSIDNVGTTEESTEWLSSDLTPTQVSGTSFSVSGDHSAEFEPGRRLRTTDSGGEDFATVIGVLVSGGITTITVDVDGGGSLDSGLSVVDWSVHKGTDWSFSDAFRSSWDWICPQGYIGGLVTSPNGTDADNDVDIAIGVCSDYAFNGPIRLTSGLTKQIDAVWAAGTNAGGMFTGSVADTTLYALWIINNPTSGAVDAGFHLSFDASTAAADWPTGYTKGQLIGYVYRRSSSVNLGWRQQKDYFRLLDIIEDVADTAVVDTNESITTIGAPPNSLAHLYGYATRTGGIGDPMALAIYPTDAVDSGSGMPTAENWAVSTGDSDARRAGASGFVLLDGDRQIHYRTREPVESPTEQVTVTINNFGCFMLTRGQAT